MGSPLAQTHPAEVIPTGQIPTQTIPLAHPQIIIITTIITATGHLVLARHVIASTVLLNDRPALGALFGVRLNPIARLTIICALLLPSTRTKHKLLACQSNSHTNQPLL